MIDKDYCGNIILCITPVDFRKGMNSLSVFVESYLERNVFDGGLYLFTNRFKDSIKILYWDNTGFAMWHKILDKEKFRWPKTSEQRVIEITKKELEWLLSGIDISKIKTHKNLDYSRVS